jgi:hypothetical protein
MRLLWALVDLDRRRKKRKKRKKRKSFVIFLFFLLYTCQLRSHFQASPCLDLFVAVAHLAP